ncbi:MAG: MBL fold metallo-hydrolase [Desulfatitalea sp.]|nr:MBL fold metallo-hydrolase [Desulfatitalea sp.]NNJ99771.1 MBL fold metallo-hydrolase [Desulfatitalea sp.]
MHITFHGAVREVTGSMHLIGTDTDHVLLDCGLHQGRRKEAAEKNRVLPFNAAMVDNMVLSHAHIDHSGRIPLLVKKGFNGRVLCTRGTADACGYLLPDSAKIQEQDAQYLNYKTVRGALSHGPSFNGRPIGKRKYEALKKMLKKDRHRIDDDMVAQFMAKYRLERVEPLYTMTDAELALGQMDGVPYRSTSTIGRDLTCTFYEAGHILGSAISIIRHNANGHAKTVAYTGDLGRFDKPILRDPCFAFEERDRHIDLMIMESTYGDRDHEPVVDLKPRLRQALTETFERGGCVLIPSFAYGRTQELLYVIHELYAEGAVKPRPVYVDSPLATNITKVFGEHPEVYDQETHATFLRNGLNPFDFKQVRFTQSVEESMALMRDNTPHIVISASGMCEAGRILHHLRYKIHNPKNRILIVGFMAQHTLGRRIQELGEAYAAKGRSGDAPLVKIFNKEYPLKAEVEKIGGFSAHADRNEMLRFLKKSNLEVKRIAVVHGEEDQSTAFAQLLRDNGFDARAPMVGQTFVV